jgi:SAM-dependent methyltransferase
MPNAIDWYNERASELSQRYEALAAEKIHAWLVPSLPTSPALVLDIGAGSGRDAAWLVSRGLEVVAIEPSAGMLLEAQRLHPLPSIRWLSDSLPSLEKVLRLGLSFDLILLSAVWMHVPVGDRSRAFRKLITLVKPGGCIAVTLRQPIHADRGMYNVSQSEIEQLARAHGAFVEVSDHGKDELSRDSVSWTQLLVRLPDDGTGALPLIRHIILNDDKSSTYKLALLRVLSRIADSSAGYADDKDDGYVAVPLGLVGLYWIRLFKPLLAYDLPQSPANRGYDRLGFVKEGFRCLANVSHLDLRIGMLFGDDRSTALHSALRDACHTIRKMPANFTTYPGGGVVFPIKREGKIAKPATLHLDLPYLSSFGELLVPRHLWRALQRFDIWIEPALIAEWSSLISSYAETQGRKISKADIVDAMKWSEPNRDVKIARDQAVRLMRSGKVYCVWTGRALTDSSLDVDHCFPWAVWPCDDLWNLLPADRAVNQHKKRDKLPGLELLQSAQQRIEGWWDRGYVKADNHLLSERFMAEAKATLPIAKNVEPRLDDVFRAVNWQQLRLKNDQQVPVWEPDAADA